MDFVLMNEQTGAIRIEKIASIPDQLPGQFMRGLAALDVDIGTIQRIFHGMTVGVNALIQECGARVGLITTRGFRDVLEMGRGGRKPVYDFVMRHPRPLVERRHRREVTERMAASGEVLTAIDLNELDREVDFLLSEGVESLAICFLHAYANPTHELAARQHIAKRHPGLPLTLSHETASEWREYERSSTAVLNAFIRPIVKGYLDELMEALSAADYTRPLAVMQSNGGVADARTAGSKPIRTLFSGPAGGAIGARLLCGRLGHDNVICTDVGGTTYDVAIIEDGKILERSQTDVAGRPVLGSLIDIVSIGAGGGSIAWLDHRRALQVGPHSAGASPGPVCFGRGGKLPTTTDAHLVLGRLDPEYFLGGRMKLDLVAAREAIREHIADPLGLSIELAADGIVAIAETNMANAIRSKTIERGLDPREFVSLAYGGGGGLFACAVADELQVELVIVPPAPANFSAWGILTSDYVEDRVRTRVLPFNETHGVEVLLTLDELSNQAIDAVESFGFSRTEIQVLRRLDLRFENQEYTLTVELDSSWQSLPATLAGARAGFVDAHQRLYGHGDANANIEVVAARCRAIGAVRKPDLMRNAVGTPLRPDRRRSVYFRGQGGQVNADVYERERLGSGQEIEGPAIVDEWTTTTLVPPGWRCHADDYGNLILQPVPA